MKFTPRLHARMALIVSLLVGSAAFVAHAGAAQAQSPIITDASAQPRGASQELQQDEVYRPLIGVGARFMWFWDADRSRDPFYTDDGYFNGGLTFEVQPFEHLIPGDRLLVGLEWLTGDNGGASLFGIDTQLDEQHMLATADYGYELFPWLTPYARVGLGMSFYDLSVGNLDAEDYWVLSGYGAAGLEAVARWSVQFGVRAEYGHTLRAEPSFSLGGQADTPKDEVAIASSGTDLGTVSVNGQSFTFAFFARF